MKPLSHQIENANKCFTILKKFGYVYLAGKPRSGKTLTSILIAEKCNSKIKNILILTKKGAIPGWNKFLNNNFTKNYYLTNYEQVGNIKENKYNLKLNPKDYDLVIIDESHNIGKVGKPSQRYLCIRKLCFNIPHIHLSGTAIVESGNSIYYQMSISKYNPFSSYKSFYDFFRSYGISSQVKTKYGFKETYNKYKPELLTIIDTFTIYMTQEMAGITAQAEDKIHYIELQESTKKMYNTLQKNKVLELDTGDDIICDSVIKLRTSLHMLESGVAKIDDKYISLGNTEKLDYLFLNFGDSEDVGIMCHFIGEQKLLKKVFKKAKIFSSTSHAEGVDLSYLKHFIIFSSGYSGSKHIQRRERIINVKGSNTVTVNHLLVKDAISEQVYNLVSKKQDFNNSTYKKAEL